jgi:hypothetical protein
MTTPDYPYFAVELTTVLQNRGATITSMLNYMSAQNLFADSDVCTFTLDPRERNVVVRHLVCNWQDTPTMRGQAKEFLRIWRKYDKQFKPDLTPMSLAVDASFYITDTIDVAGWTALLGIYESKVIALKQGLATIGLSPLGPGDAAARVADVMKTPLVHGFRKTKDHTDDVFKWMCHRLETLGASPIAAPGT